MPTLLPLPALLPSYSPTNEAACNPSAGVIDIEERVRVERLRKGLRSFKSLLKLIDLG